MKIALVTPPMAADPIHPYSAVPVLTGFLKQNGFEDVEQRDLSIEALDYLLSSSYLAKAEKRGAEKFATLNRKSSLTRHEQVCYRMMGNALSNSDRVIANMEKAKRILNSSDFYDPRKMFWARRIVGWGYNLLSAASYPTILASGTFSMPEVEFAKSKHLIAGIEDESNNPLLDFYGDVVLDWLADSDPGLLGISITYQSQFIPALSLVRMLKRNGFKNHIVVGGGFVSWIANFPAGARVMLEYADSFVVNEGESAMKQLATKLQTDDSLESLATVNNITLKKDDELVKGPWQMEDINSIAAPDFGDIFTGNYQSPDPIYLYQSSRGCYAGCAFCCVSKHQKASGYRRRNLDLIIDDIKRMVDHSARHNPDKEFFLFIADDTHSPPHLRKLSQRLLDEKIDIKWMCEARLDKGYTQETCDLIYEAGCRHIFFGMESASPRVLKTMMKGTHLKYMSQGLKNTAKAGIASYVSLVIGFPTETREEAQETIDFIMEHEPYIFTVGFNPFALAWGSYVYMYPEQFGVTLKEDPDCDIQIVFDYDVETGLTQEESREVAIQAQADWFNKRTRPRDFSLSLFDGYTLLYLSKYHLRFVDDLFADVDPLGASHQRKRENIQYIPNSVWSNISRSQLAHA